MTDTIDLILMDVLTIASSGTDSDYTRPHRDISPALLRFSGWDNSAALRFKHVLPTAAAKAGNSEHYVEGSLVYVSSSKTYSSGVARYLVDYSTATYWTVADFSGVASGAVDIPLPPEIFKGLKGLQLIASAAQGAARTIEVWGRRYH